MCGINTHVMMKIPKHKFPATQENTVFPGWQEKLTEGEILMLLVLFPVVFALFFSGDF